MLLNFYVEEPSAEAVLIELVPRILRDHTFEFDIFTFQGKPALLRNLPNRLKAYQHRQDDWRVIVLVDRDDDDCLVLKQQLEQFARAAGLTTRAVSPTHFLVINRIATEELEAWFFGDVYAIRKAYPRVDTNLAHQAPYRDSDAIRGGTWEHLERLLKHYHPGGLEKIRAAQDISKHMQPEHNRSQSFGAFRDALLGLFS
ncbi:MAG: DUF4276 family protein [Chloroflexota bacterium]|nr:DUF4276 family protein [Chloroflexota bacterium]